jgi:Tfp pilus assembly protein PilX
MYIRAKEKGITIYLSIVIMSILLATVLVVSVFLIDQLRMARDMENSISAFYAADSGIEQALNFMINDEAHLLPAYNSINIGGNALYTTNISCCSVSANPNCNFHDGGETCPFGGSGNINCPASRYCVRSIGSSNGVKRAIESYY